MLARVPVYRVVHALVPALVFSPALCVGLSVVFGSAVSDAGKVCMTKKTSAVYSELSTYHVGL